MWCLRSPLAGPAPVRATEYRPAGLEEIIYAFSAPLRSLLSQNRSVLLAYPPQRKYHMPRQSFCEVPEGTYSAVIPSIMLPDIAMRRSPKALRYSYACYEYSTQALGLSGQAAARQTPLSQCRTCTEGNLPPLARCKVTIPFITSSKYTQLDNPTSTPAETALAAEDTNCTEQLALKQGVSKSSASPSSFQKHEHSLRTPLKIQRKRIQFLQAQLQNIQARLKEQVAASSTANEEQAETIQAGRAAVSRLQDALTARAQALQSDEDGSTNRGLRTDAAEEPQTFAQRRAKLQRLLPGAAGKARKAEALQAVLDQAAVLEAEAHSAGQQRLGLVAHHNSLIAYQKVEQDAAPNPYWDNPEGLVQAALERRAAQRKQRSASHLAAAKSSQPQPQKQAAQGSALRSEPPALPAAQNGTQSTPEQCASAPAAKRPESSLMACENIAQVAAPNPYWEYPEGLVQAAPAAEQDSFTFPKLPESSHMACGKIAQVAAPNPYWEYPEGLVQAAVERRASQRKKQSLEGAAKSTQQPQPEEQSEKQAAQKRPSFAEPAAQPAAQSAPERRQQQSREALPSQSSQRADPQKLTGAPL